MLIHYGFWALILKICSFSIITAFGYEKNLLRQGLILLPANFLEGWVVAVAIRYAVLNEKTPEPLNAKAGPNTPHAIEARRAILGGILIYLLIKLAGSFSGGLMMDFSASAPEETPEAGAQVYIALMVATAIMVWAFRYIWLYVPVMMNIDITHYLKAIQGFNSSLYIIGLWVMCLVPALFVLLMGSKILMIIFPGSTPDGASLFYMQAFAAWQAFIEMVIAVVSSVAMAYGIQEMMGRSKKSRVVK